ncbi:MAG: hypothetical protein ACE5K8_04885 [Candidatus Zixiibacteriota bacterium]
MLLSKKGDALGKLLTAAKTALFCFLLVLCQGLVIDATILAAENLWIQTNPSRDNTPAPNKMISVGTKLNQLHNGTITKEPKWSNGNINHNNSCYSEGDCVPFRYFATGVHSETNHVFTIQMEWTKNGIHAYDYIACYDASEDSSISEAGGPCGSEGSSPPADCSSDLTSFKIPDPRDTANWTGLTQEDLNAFADFFNNPDFPLQGCDSIKTYGTTVTGFSKYFFTGTDANRELNLKVYFTVDNPQAEEESSVGFFWGGHLAQGTPEAWGLGNGAASISGAPYHMRAIKFDDGGVSSKDRSVQTEAVCQPPEIDIDCAQTVCGGNTSVCRDYSTAEKHLWTILEGGYIVGDSTLDSVLYFVTAPTGVT